MNCEISNELYSILNTIRHIYDFPILLIKSPKYGIEVKIAIPVRDMSYALDIIKYLNKVNYLLIDYEYNDLNPYKLKELYFRKKE